MRLGSLCVDTCDGEGDVLVFVGVKCLFRVICSFRFLQEIQVQRVAKSGLRDEDILSIYIYIFVYICVSTPVSKEL